MENVIGYTSNTGWYTGPCQNPPGEVPTDVGWDPVFNAPVREFQMGLLTQFGTTFVGRTAHEEYAGGDSFGCLGGSLGGAMQTPTFVLTSNSYVDHNGYAFPDWYNIVNCQGIFPCQFTVYQNMVMDCTDGSGNMLSSYVWTTNTITIGVNTGTVTAVHVSGSSYDGVPATVGGTFGYP